MKIHMIERTACELCSNPNTKQVYREKFTSKPLKHFTQEWYNDRIPTTVLDTLVFEVRTCLKCGFIWQSSILNEKGMADLYGSWIDIDESLSKKEHGTLERFTRYAGDIAFMGARLTTKPHEAAVLDFGMGWGYWSRMAKAHNFNVFGFELDPTRQHYAEKFGITVIEKEEELYENSYDIVNIEQVLEHIPNPLQTLKQIVSCLKPHGVIHIAVPNGQGILKKIARANWTPSHDALHPLEHINCFTPKTLSLMANEVGLARLPRHTDLYNKAKQLLGLKPITTDEFFIKKTNAPA